MDSCVHLYRANDIELFLPFSRLRKSIRVTSTGNPTSLSPGTHLERSRGYYTGASILYCHFLCRLLFSVGLLKRKCFDTMGNSLRKRLRNIADNADRKAHNLYLNHTQATPNAEYVDYEDEETDCSSDISEVILNLNTYKPSTSNRLISFTDRKYKQLTSFVAKSSQVRLGLLSTAVVGDRFGVSDRDVVAIASSVLHDVGLITSKNSDLVVDENKLRREKAKVRKDLKFQASSEAQALPLKGLYFDGRKDSTLIEERVVTKRYKRKAKEARLCLIEELSSRYITHLAQQDRFSRLL
ncbi:hypothetical protein AVEN_39550-1 [Araneus ventricosus]|uniref:Uncharacterized protein n=1 Tax=Araneus ventricosus TaxID=182803 RepID=A0A4Y2LKF8_ARAVE|nr:hypothetical protein AVEN_39550-1 [Araneus ventricosus]